MSSNGTSPDAHHRGGEYAERGDYHRTVDKKWRYYPVYAEKMAFVRAYLDRVGPDARIVDLGCGEGVLVEEYARKGFDIVGVDFNYSSEFVRRGDMTALTFEHASYDRVFALDVIEHLDFAQQELAFAEIARVLRPGGRALVSLPNLAHFASRLTFLALGKLLRTATIDRHKGDRPIGEYIELARAAGFRVVDRKGLFPTYPVISLATWFAPDRALPLHRVANRLRPPPGHCFLNILELAHAG